jgi:hypothetical protein
MRAFGRIGRDGMQTHRGNGLGGESEEKREPASDVDIAEVDSLKVLDPEWPIREADFTGSRRDVSDVP